jgi:hypothetical protein
MAEKRKIFISYKRNVEPDERVALDIFSELSQSYDVFIDLKMIGGTKWSLEIEENILNAEFFISLISTNSIKSDMVRAEIKIAYQECKLTGSPLLLPVRLNYFADLDYELKAYLDPRNYISWKSYSETQSTIDQLRQAIEGYKLTDERVLDIIKQRQNETENRIKQLLIDWDFDKAFVECEKALEQTPQACLIHMYTAISMLKGKGADSYKTPFIKRIEKHLELACEDKAAQPTALIIWGIVKHDHYFLGRLFQSPPSVDDIKKQLQDSQFNLVDTTLLNLIKTDSITYNRLGLPQFTKK